MAPRLADQRRRGEVHRQPEATHDRWRREDLPVIHGWTKALTVWVPHGGLSDRQEEPPDDRVLWLPEAPPGRMAGIHVAIVSPNGGTPGVDALPVDAFRLNSGEAVVVLYSTAVIPDGLFESLAATMSGSLTRDQVEAIDSATAPRIGIFGSDADGCRIVYECRVEIQHGEVGGPGSDGESTHPPSRNAERAAARPEAICPGEG